MAFRRVPQQEESRPSPGYRLSSDRQPGIEQANRRTRPQDEFLRQWGDQTPERPWKRLLRRLVPERPWHLPQEPMPMPISPAMPMPSPGDYRRMPPRDYRRGIGSLGDQAAVDPSDWRVLQQILGAGGNPDDYLETAMRPDEGIMQMAELTQDQMNMMGKPINTPDFGVSKEDLWNRTKGMEDKGLFGFGAQEPTTREEFEDYYRQLQAGTAGNWVT